MKAKSGQVALYLVLVLVALTVFMLMNTGAFLAVRAKNRAMNAGDAAALASARRQAQLLNRIGRLNLAHAEADFAGDYEKSLEIVAEQRRLAFLGPVECLRDAQDAARANGAQPSPEMTEILTKHIADVRGKYMNFPELYPEPWDGAWAEYAAALSSIVSDGVVAGCDNIDFIDMAESFPLTSKSFYAMVEGESWCKLVVAGWTWLLDLDSHNMPRPVQRELAAVVNCEFCSLHLTVKALPPWPDETAAAVRGMLAANGAEFPPDVEPAADDRAQDDPSRCYFFYDGEYWREWVEMHPDSSFHFPIIGRVKPVFDVMGCTSVFRVKEPIPRLLEGTAVEGPWSAAAKPFGKITLPGGEAPVTAEEAKGLVLPSYEAVRLVPLSAAYVGCRDTSTADGPWLDHVREHVASYLDRGVESLPPGCRYCKSLVKWEDAAFRAKAARWIEENGDTCMRSSPGPGPALHGGTPYAH
ncbi:MAG: hypothetical protein J6T01_02685 [Kiritimatiellae bacterium]|nr:hypothetical protein [Kiritimatiellia bacterium]